MEVISGIGADIVKVERFAKFAASPCHAFMLRVFTDSEREYLSGKPAQSVAQTAAGIFAAKEAVAKALGTGFVGFSPADIEILHKKTVRPTPSCTMARKKRQRAIASAAFPCK
jgi:holo-[acyl-carrier protein] synthase